MAMGDALHVLVTEPTTLAPAASASALDWARGVASVPVKQTTFPESDMSELAHSVGAGVGGGEGLGGCEEGSGWLTIKSPSGKGS